MLRRVFLASGVAAFVGLLVPACSKPDAHSASPPAAASGAASAPPPSVSVSAAPVSSAPPTVTWRGTYTSAPGSLYVYDGGEWKGFHFRGDDAAVALGEGALEVTIDDKTHVARGTIAGPLGDGVVTGAVTGSELSFSVLRKEAKDRGFTGTGSATIAGETATGTMRLSRADAHVIREAKFTLTKSAPR